MYKHTHARNNTFQVHTRTNEIKKKKCDFKCRLKRARGTCTNKFSIDESATKVPQSHVLGLGLRFVATEFVENIHFIKTAQNKCEKGSAGIHAANIVHY